MNRITICSHTVYVVPKPWHGPSVGVAGASKREMLGPGEREGPGGKVGETRRARPGTLADAPS
jgi:hypothetical protein